MTFLLDTDTLSLLQHSHPIVVRNIQERAESSVFLSAISLQEQMTGWLGRLSRLKSQKQVADWYDRLVVRLLPAWNRFVVLAFLEPAIVRFESLRKQRLNVAPMDLRIAAIALEHGMAVVTHNRRDFGRVAGLTIEDWTV